MLSSTSVPASFNLTKCSKKVSLEILQQVYLLYLFNKPENALGPKTSD